MSSEYDVMVTVRRVLLSRATDLTRMLLTALVGCLLAV